MIATSKLDYSEIGTGTILRNGNSNAVVIGIDGINILIKEITEEPTEINIIGTENMFMLSLFSLICNYRYYDETKRLDRKKIENMLMKYKIMGYYKGVKCIDTLKVANKDLVGYRMYYDCDKKSAYVYIPQKTLVLVQNYTLTTTRERLGQNKRLVGFDDYYIETDEGKRAIKLYKRKYKDKIK